MIDYFLPWIAFLFPQNSPIPTLPSPANCATGATIEGKGDRRSEWWFASASRRGNHLPGRGRSFRHAADNPHYDETYLAVPIHAGTERRACCTATLRGGDRRPVVGDPHRVGQTGATTLVRARETRYAVIRRRSRSDARRGKDNMATAKRYGTWSAEVKRRPASTSKTYSTGGFAGAKPGRGEAHRAISIWT